MATQKATVKFRNNALPVNELEAKMSDLKEEYLRLRCGHVSRQLADVLMIKKTRRNIARLNTVLTEIQA